MQALDADQSSSERGVYFRNRAAVYLKLQQYQEAVADCTAGMLTIKLLGLILHSLTLQLQTRYIMRETTISRKTASFRLVQSRSLLNIFSKANLKKKHEIKQKKIIKKKINWLRFFAALAVDAHDVKSLYRRCQAYEQLGFYDEAYSDAALLTRLEPENTAIRPVLSQLYKAIQNKVTFVLFSRRFNA